MGSPAILSLAVRPPKTEILGPRIFTQRVTLHTLSLLVLLHALCCLPFAGGLSGRATCCLPVCVPPLAHCRHVVVCVPRDRFQSCLNCEVRPVQLCARPAYHGVHFKAQLVDIKPKTSKRATPRNPYI